jgi:hypothetical protein
MRNAGYPTHPFHGDGFPEQDIVCTPYNSQPSTRKKTVIGMDCEMCLTEQGSEITRVTLVDFQGNTLYDELVKPENPIIDYLTTYHISHSQLTKDGPESLKNDFLTPQQPSQQSKQLLLKSSTQIQS